jgi:hypothetical protein
VLSHLIAERGLAQVCGFTDLDGSRPDAWRCIEEVQDAGKPADTTGLSLKDGGEGAAMNDAHSKGENEAVRRADRHLVDRADLSGAPGYWRPGPVRFEWLGSQRFLIQRLAPDSAVLRVENVKT